MKISNFEPKELKKLNNSLKAKREDMHNSLSLIKKVTLYFKSLFSSK